MPPGPRLAASHQYLKIFVRRILQFRWRLRYTNCLLELLCGYAQGAQKMGKIEDRNLARAKVNELTMKRCWA